MKSNQFKQLIREEVQKALNEAADYSYHRLYIANKDTMLGKTKVPKGTVIRAVGGGNWESVDGKIKTHIAALLDTPDFDKVENPVWPMTIELTKEIENWARETTKLIQKRPEDAQGYINYRTRVINDIKKLLK